MLTAEQNNLLADQLHQNTEIELHIKPNDPCRLKIMLIALNPTIGSRQYPRIDATHPEEGPS